MAKIDMISLPNGVTLILNPDTTKHTTEAKLIVRFGGLNHQMQIAGKDYYIEDGVAHFLEHLVIDHSIYGNAYDDFQKNYAALNGVTTKNYTAFYFHTVHDFPKLLEKLIRVVTESKFTKQDIEESKPVIIEEINQTMDQEFRQLAASINNAVFHNFQYSSNIGSASYINALDYETIKLWYDVFYQPQNQILAISGNFDIANIKELVMNIYAKIKHPVIAYRLKSIQEPAMVKQKESTISAMTAHNYTELTFKIPITKWLKDKLLPLSYILDCFLFYNFGSLSKAYKYCLDQHISTYPLSYSYDFSYIKNGYLIISVGVYTDKSDDFIALVLETVKNSSISEEDFNTNQKDNIITLLLREDNIFAMLESYLNNYLFFDYPELETIQDIERMTLVDYHNYLKHLDFSEYAINYMIKKESMDYAHR